MGDFEQMLVCAQLLEYKLGFERAKNRSGNKTLGKKSREPSLDMDSDCSSSRSSTASPAVKLLGFSSESSLMLPS